MANIQIEAEKFGDADADFNLGFEFKSRHSLAAIEVHELSLVAYILLLVGNPVCAIIGRRKWTIFVLLPEAENISSTSLGTIDLLADGHYTVVLPRGGDDNGISDRWFSQSLSEINPADLPILDNCKLEILKLIVEAENPGDIFSHKDHRDGGSRMITQLVQLGLGDSKIWSIMMIAPPLCLAGVSFDDLQDWMECARDQLVACQIEKGGQGDE